LSTGAPFSLLLPTVALLSVGEIGFTSVTGLGRSIGWSLIPEGKLSRTEEWKMGASILGRSTVVLWPGDATDGTCGGVGGLEWKLGGSNFGVASSLDV
jgi:hypothetical protein